MIQVSGIFAGSGGDYIPPITEADFTYTGTYSLLDDGDGNWRLKFLSDGSFTSIRDLLVDAFYVGGGGGGGGFANVTGCGGGGGYTRTVASIVLQAGIEYQIVVGQGGLGSSGTGSNGGASSAFGYSANGGEGGGSVSGGKGGNGGSGGGAGQYRDNAYATNGPAGDGGTNGGNGGSTAQYTGGTGQGTPTTEFGETGAELYSAGGGGAHTLGAYAKKPGNGGAGGSSSLTSGGGIASTNGIPSMPTPVGGTSPQFAASGGGGGGYGAGGGGAYDSIPTAVGGDGCQGIVIIRKHKEAA